MTTRSGCRALYLSRLDISMGSNSPGTSEPEPLLGSAGSTGPELRVSGE